MRGVPHSFCHMGLLFDEVSDELQAGINESRKSCLSGKREIISFDESLMHECQGHGEKDQTEEDEIKEAPE